MELLQSCTKPLILSQHETRVSYECTCKKRMALHPSYLCLTGSNHFSPHPTQGRWYCSGFPSVCFSVCLFYLYMYRTANTSWRMSVIIKQMQSNSISTCMHVSKMAPVKVAEVGHGPTKFTKQTATLNWCPHWNWQWPSIFHAKWSLTPAICKVGRTQHPTCCNTYMYLFPIWLVQFCMSPCSVWVQVMSAVSAFICLPIFAPSQTELGGGGGGGGDIGMDLPSWSVHSSITFFCLPCISRETDQGIDHKPSGYIHYGTSLPYIMASNANSFFEFESSNFGWLKIL